MHRWLHGDRTCAQSSWNVRSIASGAWKRNTAWTVASALASWPWPSKRWSALADSSHSRARIAGASTAAASHASKVRSVGSAIPTLPSSRSHAGGG